MDTLFSRENDLNDSRSADIMDKFAALNKWLGFNHIEALRMHRFFSDGVEVAKLLKKFYPKLINLDYIKPRTSSDMKFNNWKFINERTLSKLNLKQSDAKLEKIAKSVPGVIESLLLQIKDLPKIVESQYTPLYEVTTRNHKKLSESKSKGDVVVTISKRLGPGVVHVMQKRLDSPAEYDAMLKTSLGKLFLPKNRRLISFRSITEMNRSKARHNPKMKKKSSPEIQIQPLIEDLYENERMYQEELKDKAEYEYKENKESTIDYQTMKKFPLKVIDDVYTMGHRRSAGGASNFGKNKDQKKIKQSKSASSNIKKPTNEIGKPNRYKKQEFLKNISPNTSKLNAANISYEKAGSMKSIKSNKLSSSNEINSSKDKSRSLKNAKYDKMGSSNASPVSKKKIVSIKKKANELDLIMAHFSKEKSGSNKNKKNKLNTSNDSVAPKKLSYLQSIEELLDLKLSPVSSKEKELSSLNESVSSSESAKSFLQTKLQPSLTAMAPPIVVEDDPLRSVMLKKRQFLEGLEKLRLDQIRNSQKSPETSDLLNRLNLTKKKNFFLEPSDFTDQPIMIQKLKFDKKPEFIKKFDSFKKNVLKH